MSIHPCTHDAHSAAILEIFNEAIAHSTALYDYEPRTPESMVTWFETKEAGNFPVLGEVDDSGRLLARQLRALSPLACLQVFNRALGLRSPRSPGKGLGMTLMRSLMAAAVEQQYHVMIGGSISPIEGAWLCTKSSVSRTRGRSTTRASSSAIGWIGLLSIDIADADPPRGWLVHEAFLERARRR